MEHYKIFKSLNDSTVSKFVTKKWIKVNDLSSGKNSVDKQVVNILSTKRLKTSMLRSYLCDNSDACIVVNDLLVAAANKNDKPEKDVAFKNNPPFRSCISKIKSTLTYNADLDIVC